MESNYSSESMRRQIIKLISSGIMLLLFIEICIFVFKCVSGIFDESEALRYFSVNICIVAIWNLCMIIMLMLINDSENITDKRKTELTVFIITKICASISIIYVYQIPSQCVFVVAILTAAMMSDVKCIMFTTFDSIFMLAISIIFCQFFNFTLPFSMILKSSIASSALLLFTGVMAHFIARSNDRKNKLIAMYTHDLKKATNAAKHDAMTGLYHHAEFYNILDSIVTQNGKSIIIAIMDIDNFKAINDTYGHDNGDKVILMIAECVKIINDDENIFVARYGGEEFAFIFINISRDEAEEKLQHIRKIISEYRFDFDENKMITISCGLFECYTKTYSTEDVFAKADSALYYAKKHGKNQLIAFDKINEK